jgi:peptidoglycan/LPS O-acetylase OafA/YrhL
MTSGTRDRFIAGNPLRAVAALSVLVYHTAYYVAKAAGFGWFYGAYDGFAGHVLGSMDLGLFVFFVLSGYLISFPFVNAFIRGASPPHVGQYLWRRLLRIVPAFWIILTILLLCVGSYGASSGQLAGVYGFAQNYGNAKISRIMGQAWTLDVELAFYVALPVVMAILAGPCRRLGERDRRRILYAVLAGGALLSLALRALGPTSVTPSTFAWQTSLPSMAFAFIPGVALAALETTHVPARLRARGSSLPAALVLAIGLMLLAVFASRTTTVSPQFLDALGGFLAAAGTGALVGSALVMQWSTGSCWRVLDNRLMHWTGERSYSLYLVHLVIAIAIALGWSTLTSTATVRLAIVLPVVVTASVGVAAGSYRLFERPFLRMRIRREADQHVLRA